MFAASQLLAQIEFGFVPTQSDAAQEPNICSCRRLIIIVCSSCPFTSSVTVSALERAAFLPDNWIPDDDLYGIRKRARRLLAMTGADRSESSATAPPAGDPRPADTGAIQFSDKDPVLRSEPIVKRESSEPRYLPLVSRRKLTAAKRRLGEGSRACEDSSAVDHDRQPSKRVRFSLGHGG